MSNPSYRTQGRKVWFGMSGGIYVARQDGSDGEPLPEGEALTNEQLTAMDAAVAAEVAAKDAEIERLRKALEEIANSPGRSFHIERIAKAALGETPREFETIFACRPVEGSEK